MTGPTMNTGPMSRWTAALGVVLVLTMTLEAEAVPGFGGDQVTVMTSDQADLFAARVRTAEAVASGVDARVAALEELVAQLLVDRTEMSASLAGVNEQLAALEAVDEQLEMDLTPLQDKTRCIQLSSQTGSESTMQIAGCNLQVVAEAGGDSSWMSVPNGLGNVILGHNEGQTASKTGSHNLIVGPGHEYSASGAVLAGTSHKATVDGAALVGGSSNEALAAGCAVFGGEANQCSNVENCPAGSGSVVVGGWSNTADCTGTVVVGGVGSSAVGARAVVVGGEDNEAIGELSVVLAGSDNKADGLLSSVTGGGNNRASGDRAAVFGGGGQSAEDGNTASGVEAVVLGGRFVHAAGAGSALVGGFNNTASESSHMGLVLGGRSNVVRGEHCATLGGGHASSETVDWLGNVADGSNNVIVGGYRHKMSSISDSNVIVGGDNHKILEASRTSTIIGGQSNDVRQGVLAHIAGGSQSLIEGPDDHKAQGQALFGTFYGHSTGARAVVVGGRGNKAHGELAVVVGGLNNEVLENGQYGVVAGGGGNKVTGKRAVNVGGNGNIAGGDTYNVVLGGLRNIIEAAAGDTEYEPAGSHNVLIGGSDNRAEKGVQYLVGIGGDTDRFDTSCNVKIHLADVCAPFN